jgi:hypothetical protein
MAQAQGDHRGADSNSTARVAQEKAAAVRRQQAAATAGRGSRRV